MIRDMEEERFTPASDARSLAELLANRLNATVGTAKLTLIFRDGRLTDSYRNTRHGPKELSEIPVTLP
jgi:hypothetical protein